MLVFDGFFSENHADAAVEQERLSLVAVGEQLIVAVGVEVLVGVQVPDRLQVLGDVVRRLPEGAGVVESEAGRDPVGGDAVAILQVEEVGEDLVFDEGQ